MTSHYCIHCNRTFYFKDLYDKHEAPCKYFYKSRRDKRYEEELIEVLPNPQETYKLIQSLVLKIQRLEEDVLRLKNNSNIQTRKNVANILSSVRPTHVFSVWIHDFIVNNTHLDKVFNYDLTEGMIMCLKDRIQDEGGCENVPIRCIKEQSNIVYVFTDDGDNSDDGDSDGDSDDSDKIQQEPSWKKCNSEHIHSMISWLTNEFIKAFCKWEDENETLIHSTIQEQDKHTSKMLKIIGKINKDKQTSELKNWLLKNLH